MKKLFYAISLVLMLNGWSQSHPVLLTPEELSELSAGNGDWSDIEDYCSTYLNTIIDPGWAGWDWRIAIENYSKAYQVLQTSQPVLANNYGLKTLALMKAAARHHNMGGPANAQFVGFGTGSSVSYTLPFLPMNAANVVVLTTDMDEEQYTYTSNVVDVGRFQPILKISNASGGANNYSTNDYRLAFRNGFDVWRLLWPTATHPATNANYFVTYYNPGADQVVNSGSYTITGTTLTLSAPAGRAVFVRMLGADYEQTGNYLGGVNSVQPDGPGYQMRTFNPGLAYGFDLLYNFAPFNATLKTEFSEVLNDQIEWYEDYGYENDGALGNYFIRGLYTATMFTAYGTEGANSNTSYLMTKTDEYTDRVFGQLQSRLPGGYGPQGQYTNGTITDIVQIFTIYKGLAATDLLSQLEWTDHVVPATIHGTKPDRVSFYDGGDWDNLPAQTLTDGMRSFLQYLPNHPTAPYARQLIQDAGESNIPAGTITDFKSVYPPAYCGKVCGPVYTRTDWSTSAVWASFFAGEVFMDHQHFDQGHFTIQRGADELVLDAGEYGDRDTDPYHNTLLIDDRGQGDISTYPPGQGAWGFADNRIVKFENTGLYTYSAADITRAYARHHEGLQNSVGLAYRSFLFIRPDLIIIHDQTRTPNANVQKIFNVNFSRPLTTATNVHSFTRGSSKLFYRSVLPAAVSPVFSTIAGKDANYRNAKVTTSGQSNTNLLNVFQATGTAVSAMTGVDYLNSTDLEGLEVSAQDSTWVALFSKNDSVAEAEFYTYNFTKTGPQRHIVMGLQRDFEYQVSVESGASDIMILELYPTSENGVMTFAFNSPGTGTVTFHNPLLKVQSSADQKALHQVYVHQDQLHLRCMSDKNTVLNARLYRSDAVQAAEYTFQISEGENHLTQNISGIASGAYILEVSGDTGTQSYKLIR